MSLEMNANLTKMYDFAKTAIGHEALSGEDSVIQTRRNAPGLVGRKWTKLGGPKCTYGLREVHRCIFKSALGGGLRKLRLDHHPYMDKGFGDACLDEDPRRFHRNRPTCFAKIGAILVGRHRRCRRFNEVLQLPQ